MTGESEIFGYVFSDPQLLAEALSTPSCKMDSPGAADNQRLEFLGDAVLGLLSAKHVYEKFPRASEGELTVKRTHMVSSPALCRAAVKAGLAARLRQNRAAKPIPPNSKTLADAIEAVIGAAYLDGGFEAAGKIYGALELEQGLEDCALCSNPKGELQERAQAMKPPRQPVYELLGVSGQAHCPLFTVKVSVEGMGEAEASAPVRKEAEAQAAAKLLHV
jgi:ribonuclease-3